MPKTTKKPVKKPVKKPSKPYKLSIRVNDTVFETSAKDMESALVEYVESPLFPVGAKTNAFIKYSKGKNERHKLWHTPQARRMLRTMKFKGSLLKVLASKFEEDLA